MKKLINLVVLFLLLGTSAFAAIPAKLKTPNAKPNEQVSFIPLRLKSGFAVMVNKLEPGKSVVIFYDNDQNVIFKDVLTKGTKAEKKYILSELDDGDYSVEVYSKNHDIKTHFSVYNRGERKVSHMN
jgi:hypothetical protein